MSDHWNDVRTMSRQLGANVRQQRIRLRMKQATLARDLWIDPPALSRIETGVGVPDEYTGRRLTEWLDSHLQSSESVEQDTSAISMPIVTPTPARATHPHTSRKAMDSVNRETAWAIHQWIIDQLDDSDNGGLTHEQMWNRYTSRFGAPDIPKSSQSGLRTRVSELVRGGVVQDSGRTRTMTTGRQAIVWELADINRAVKATS